MRIFSVAVVTAGVALAFGAMAQPADGWDYSSDASRGSSTARAEFAAGIGVSVRCRGGALRVDISGTPLSTETYRPSILERAGERPV